MASRFEIGTPPPLRRLRASTTGGVIAVALIATVLGAGPSEVRAQEPLVVEFVPVTATPVSSRFEATGEVAARELISAAFPEGGRVVVVNFDEGDRVSAGTVLARIDETQQRESFNAAEATLRAEEATLTEAAADEGRQARLLDRGFTTRATRQDALQTLRAAESAVAQARADVEQAQSSLDDTELTAPVDAIVTDRAAEEGQVLGAAEAAFTLAPQGQLDAVFNVPDALFIDPPDAFEISLRLIDDPSVAMRGTVREVSPLVNEETGAVEVTIAITDPPAGVQIGAPIRGTITLPPRPVIKLPWTALSASDAGLAVWVVGADQTVSLRGIEVSRYETGHMTVASGLEVGETVVGDGSSFVFPDRRVVAAEPRQ